MNGRRYRSENSDAGITSPQRVNDDARDEPDDGEYDKHDIADLVVAAVLDKLGSLKDDDNLGIFEYSILFKEQLNCLNNNYHRNFFLKFSCNF